MPIDHQPAGIERRLQPTPGLRLETRAAVEGQPERKQIVGHAVVFNQPTTLYEGRYLVYREMIRPGAFTNALKEKQDVRALFNHDSNFVLGRTKSGTLTLEQDETGLLSRTDPPDTQTIRDLVLSPIERGDVSGMSFAFTVRAGEKVVTTTDEEGTVTIDRGGEVITEREEGDKLVIEREVKDANLFDVSPVTYPAYDGTDVALRSAAMPAELRTLIAERDRPRKKPAPRREQLRQYLDSL